jgi:maltokinase
MVSSRQGDAFGERGFDVDQTNHSVVVGESVVVKWLTPPAPLPQPTPDMFAHLTSVGFTATATPYAAVSRRRDDGELLLALVTAYLPDAVDGWQWCVDEAVSGGTAFAADLGVLSADLHAAMATPSETFPAPVRPATFPVRHTPDKHEHHGIGPVNPWFTRAEEAVNTALTLTDGDDGDWLSAHAGALRAEIAPLASSGAGPLIRIHGDLHVGQMLRWRDGYAVIDFDGNPTVAGADPFQPAARDLAQLTTSLEHVGQVAVRRRGADPLVITGWAAVARAALESAYLGRLAELGHSALLDRSLLRPFEIEQECRELIYAAGHLPRWRYAPMGVLRSWYR